jgi:thiosulfate dehydrogenase
MTREERAASFIYHNMPQTAPGTLTPQEAFDLAAFVNSHPRPDSPGKELDWPMGGAPKDVPYDTKGHAAYRPPPLLPRATPERALVPNPPVAGRSGR